MYSQTDYHKVLIIQGGRHEIKQRDLSDGTKIDLIYPGSSKEDGDHNVTSVVILLKIYHLIKQTQIEAQSPKKLGECS